MFYAQEILTVDPFFPKNLKKDAAAITNAGYLKKIHSPSIDIGQLLSETIRLTEKRNGL
tara:strand:+ start:27415 stop:27591 length:177 start_codon:yes stop_codon:yes gene_type:complete